MSTQRNRWWLVVVTGIAVFMAQLDATIVNVALPSIERSLATETSLTQWVVLGYVLPMIALSLPAGRWLDRVGQRAAMVFTVAGFALASAAAGLAPSVEWLIGARVLQGACGAVVFALAPVLATVAVRPEARGRAMGVMMTLGPLGGVSGPVLGGYLVQHLSWQWIFYVNVPISLVVLGVVLARLPADTPLRAPDRAWFIETAVLGTAAVVVMLALTFTARGGLGWLLLLVAATPFVLMWYRLPGSRPVRQALGGPGVAVAHVALLAQAGAALGLMFLMPFHLQARGMPATDIGLILLAFPLATMAASPVAGALADRWSARPVALAGALVLTVGLALIVPLAPQWTGVDLIWRLAIAGVGTGFFAGPVVAVAMAGSPRSLLGTIGASTSTARQIGIALGPALATTIWSLTGYSGTGMRVAVGMAAALALVSVLALALPQRYRLSADDSHATDAANPSQA